MVNLFDGAVITIFAREFMEGAIIISQYRTVIKRADIQEDSPSKDTMLRCVTISAAWAAALAVFVCICVAVPLAILSRDFDDKTAIIIEGISKVVAAVCILQLSLKIPKWLGFYKTKKNGKVLDNFDMTLQSIRFNVAWNVWREVAECGIFLVPIFLQRDNLSAVPLSALVGVVVGLTVGFFVYYANNNFKNTFYLTIFITMLLIFLSTGLFVGGCHEFEEVWGETKNVWRVKNDFWDHHDLPMAILKPFGYSSSRSVLQITTFWCWLALAAALHYWKIWATKKINSELAPPVEDSEDSLEKGNSHDDSQPTDP